MSVKWPERMPESGRLNNRESHDAWATGICSVTDTTRSCSQTLHVTLFFDGTNNNDVENNPWRDSKKQTHTNVARLYKAALLEPDQGIFKYYIPGVGTPFKEIGEDVYTSMGKAMAKGFSARCLWGYTRVLNAVYSAIATDNTRPLIRVDDARWLCEAGANGDMEGFQGPVGRLGTAHQNAVDDGARPRTVKQVWINVIGFSRGAAGARAFVHKLINEWAPGGSLVRQTGQYAIPYTVNFMGLFDTVASVGPPDSMRETLDVGSIAGHYAFAGGGAMAIPDEVRACVHAFSIHEQRMSFPLDSIRTGDSYTGDCRHEIAYPGVHSDVGGGYGPGEQGKGVPHDDSHKLSQIPLHDMYIAALKYGVPMMRAKDVMSRTDILDDFALNPTTIAAFNAWLDTTEPRPLMHLEDAMTFGMGQLLTWRTLRADVKTQADYVINQDFYSKAVEDRLAPCQVNDQVEKAKKTDPQYLALQEQLGQAEQDRTVARARRYPENAAAVSAAQDRIDDLVTKIRTRGEALCGEIAHPDAKPDGKPDSLPNSARPGETAWDVGTNDKTDLRQGAEEMRLLLAHLYPERRDDLKVDVTAPAAPATSRNDWPPAAPLLPVLSVRHEQPNSPSPRMTLVDRGTVLFHTLRTTVAREYVVADDVLPMPVDTVTHFLKRHTSLDAVARLRRSGRAAIELFDNYVHDSRCWFRVPYFHEYAPGGYFWPRVVFTGGHNRAPWLGFDPVEVALDEEKLPDSAYA